MKVVGTVTIINGSVEEITEHQVWVWRDNKPVEITIRVTPSSYGDMPHVSEIVNGQDTYRRPVENHYSSRDQLLTKRKTDLTANLERSKAGAKEIRKQLRAIEKLG